MRGFIPAPLPLPTAARAPLPSLKSFLFDLKVSVPLKGWQCGICKIGVDLEDLSPQHPPESLRRTADTPASMSAERKIDVCGHTFHIDCLYDWVESKQQARNRCPTCRTALWHDETAAVHDTEPLDCLASSNDCNGSRSRSSSTDIDRPIDPRSFIQGLTIEFFDRQWTNPTAYHWLIANLDHAFDAARDREHNFNWRHIVTQAIYTSADGRDGRLLPSMAYITRWKYRPWLCSEHDEAGLLWLELFLAERVRRRAVENRWANTPEMRNFRRYWQVLVSELRELRGLHVDYVGLLEAYTFGPSEDIVSPSVNGKECNDGCEK